MRPVAGSVMKNTEAIIRRLCQSLRRRFHSAVPTITIKPTRPISGSAMNAKGAGAPGGAWPRRPAVRAVDIASEIITPNRIAPRMPNCRCSAGCLRVISATCATNNTIQLENTRPWATVSSVKGGVGAWITDFR